MRILFVTNDRLGQRRAGPAIRCIELAKVVSRRHEVVVATSQPSDLDIEGVELVPNCLRNPKQLRAAAVRSDIVVVQGLVLALFPFLMRTAHYLVVDLYDPYLLEYLAHPHPRFPRWGYLRQWYLLNKQLLRGDFFLCATERQWDYWLGRLCALGRLTPGEYRRDPSFKSLLDIVPSGVSPDLPKHTQTAIKGVIPGIAPTDIVLLWGGGIWQWLDPFTVIRAMSLVGQERSDIKLLFLCTQHPNPDIRQMPILQESRTFARELGVLDHFVFFREGWVPFKERQNYLLEADIGVSAHLDTPESRLSFRIRVLDYIWAGLPMLLSQGDYFAELVEREKMGQTLPAGDVRGWKEAILSLASDRERRKEHSERLRNLSAKFHWERVAEPLLRFCAQPYSRARIPRWPPYLVALASFLYQPLDRVKRLRRWRRE